MASNHTSTHARFARRLPQLIAICAAAILPAACSDNNGFDGPVEMQYWDIATYEGPSSQGGSVFTFRQVNDSPVITLTSSSALPKAEAGQRMAVRYIPESGKPYTSGPVRLLSASKVTQSDIATEWKDEYNDWARDKVYVYSIWRSGNYINVNVRLTYDTEPRTFCLAAAPGTLTSACPDVYLVHIMARETESHDRAYLASFDIGALWDRPSVSGLRIHVANSNLDKDIFTFKKTD